MGRAIGLLFKGHFKEAAAEGLKGVKALSGYDARLKAASRVKDLVTHVSTNYATHLGQEKARDAQKKAVKEQSTGKSIGMVMPMMSRSQPPTGQPGSSRVVHQGDVKIHYAPTITISGGTPQDKAAFSKLLKDHERELEQALQRIFNKNARISFT
jgi:hypothetical protein